jgi:hypothetical protein
MSSVEWMGSNSLLDQQWQELQQELGELGSLWRRGPVGYWEAGEGQGY